MGKYTLEQIKKVMVAKGYSYLTGTNQLNIIGVRESLDLDKFNDEIYLLYNNGVETLKGFLATTKPGKYWMEHPMNVKGTGILAPGQYPNSHCRGKHQGQYNALVQCGNLSVYRDSNKDDVFDLILCSLEKGAGFGINIHHAGINSTLVGKWSAACQVFANEADFDFMMSLVSISTQKFFTYTLLTSQDFNIS